MQERAIPVDLIAGNSMGALIAAQYALGADLETIILQATQAFAAGGEWLM
ncbi:hypothetical protein [Roseateles sp.]|nr:hypothetical protein [Roseateles sp.]